MLTGLHLVRIDTSGDGEVTSDDQGSQPAGSIRGAAVLHPVDTDAELAEGVEEEPEVTMADIHREYLGTALKAALNKLYSPKTEEGVKEIKNWIKTVMRLL